MTLFEELNTNITSKFLLITYNNRLYLIYSFGAVIISTVLYVVILWGRKLELVHISYIFTIIIITLLLGIV